MLFVGSCFADSIGQRFREEQFRATVNPYGTMYNPASVLHSVERFFAQSEEEVTGAPRVVFLTLGTNHVYRLNETGEIVDNCQKRPQRLFTEERLTVDECADYLRQTVEVLRRQRSDVQVVLTVSPIRYQKYGFHESQLSKATLILAVDQLISQDGREASSLASPPSTLHYFPAYEIVLDELRDYRFYKEDMLHPSAQAVEYIWERIADLYLSPAARQFLEEWRPVKEALAHRPFHPDSEQYQAFLRQVQERKARLEKKYGPLG
jgi:lysophospholipase L1-like esterase